MDYNCYPLPPRIDRLPQAIKQLELAAKNLIPCGPGLRSVLYAESPTARLIAIADLAHQDTVFAGLTAAWIWGCTATPYATKHRMMSLTPPGKYSTTSALTLSTEHTKCYSRRLTETDFIRFAGDLQPVTTPERTISDLKRKKSPSISETEAITKLEQMLTGSL